MTKRILAVLALLLAVSLTMLSCELQGAPETSAAPETTAEPQGTTEKTEGTTAEPDGTTAEITTDESTASGETTAETTAETTDAETTTGSTVAIVTRPEGETTAEPGSDSPEYVSLGDSIANGYGLDNPSKTSYSALIKDELDYAKLLSSCTDGQTSSQLLTAVNALEFDGSKTELITVSTGANNILGPASTRLFQLMLQPEKALEALYSPEFDAELRAGVAQLREDLPKIIERLRTLAPDAEIVLLSVYNPFDGAKVAINVGGGTTDVALGEMTETYILLMNEVIKDVAEEEGCTVADVYTAFRSSTEQVVNVTTDESGYITTSYDPHPNAAGHRLIAVTVLAARKDA